MRRWPRRRPRRCSSVPGGRPHAKPRQPADDATVIVTLDNDRITRSKQKRVDEIEGTRPRQVDWDDLFYAPWTCRHHDDLIPEKDRLVDGVCHDSAVGAQLGRALIDFYIAVSKLQQAGLVHVWHANLVRYHRVECSSVVEVD